MSEERRCAACGALAAADAEWCGQCFASLRAPDPALAPTAPSTQTASPTVAGERRAPYWPCGLCGAENPLDADVCTTCGTPFAQVMRVDPERVRVDPDVAFRTSLLFPGLGHRAVGRGMDGLARGVLFATSALMAILTGLAATNPLTTVIFLVFLVAAIGVYIATAIEARTLARGGGLLVSSRTLLWILVGLVFVSVGLLGYSVVTALRK